MTTVLIIIQNVTCLHTAAALGRIEIAKYLVENTSLREHIDIIDDVSCNDSVLPVKGVWINT